MREDGAEEKEEDVLLCDGRQRIGLRPRTTGSRSRRGEAETASACDLPHLWRMQKHYGFAAPTSDGMPSLLPVPSTVAIDSARRAGWKQRRSLQQDKVKGHCETSEKQQRAVAIRVRPLSVEYSLLRDIRMHEPVAERTWSGRHVPM